jgi:hypothetical protein
LKERLEGELRLGQPSSAPPGVAPNARRATPSRTGYAASSNPHAEPPRSKLWVLALGLVAFGVALLAWGLRGKAPLSAAPAGTAAARLVHVSIAALPATANIFIDELPVSNPYRAERAFDGQLHRVRLTAEGYAAQEIEVRFDSDLQMFRALSPLARLAPSSALAPASSGPPAVRPDASAPASGSPASRGL